MHFDQHNTILFVAIFLGATVFSIFIAMLFGASNGEIVGALGSVIGGAIGALGAAAAVYLTLHGHRAEESEKTTLAVFSEVSELVKFPMGQLGACGKILTGQVTAPKHSLPMLMVTPEPVIYRAIADRISRMPKPSLVVSFYYSLQETRAVVATIVNTPNPNEILTRFHVTELADMLIHQCQLARYLLSEIEIASETELAKRTREVRVAQIDEQLAAAKQLFPDAESFNPNNSPETGKDSDLIKR